MASNEANIPNNIPPETRAIVEIYSSYCRKLRSLKQNKPLKKNIQKIINFIFNAVKTMQPILYNLLKI